MFSTKKSDDQVNTILHLFKKNCACIASDRNRQILWIFGIGWVLKKWNCWIPILKTINCWGTIVWAGWGCFFGSLRSKSGCERDRASVWKGLFFLLWTHQLVQLLKQREQLSPVYRCWFVRAFSGALRNALFSRVCFWGFLSSQTDFKGGFF